MTTRLPSNFIPPAISATPGIIDGIVARDIPCRKCSYNLRTLSAGGFCPECGTAVAVSIYGNLLRYSEPQWVHALARGALYIVIGACATIIIAFFGGIFIAIVGASHLVRLSTARLILQFPSFAADLLVLLGSWWVTQRDRSGIGEDEYGTARKIVRISLLLALGNAFLGFRAGTTALPTAASQLVAALSAILGLARLVGLIAQIYYFEKLALRIPDPSLSTRARFLKVALSISYGSMLAIGLVGMLFVILSRSFNARSTADLVPVMIFGCGAGICAIATLVFAVMYLFMVNRFRISFTQQAALAEQNWRTAHPA